MGKHWTSEQDEKLKLLYPNTRIQVMCDVFGCTRQRIHARANKLGLKKVQFFTTVTEKSKATQFKKGMISWNKGLKLGSDWCKATQFKPGHQTHNKLPDELREVASQLSKVKRNILERKKRKENK
jgi:hypothetical protein